MTRRNFIKPSCSVLSLCAEAQATVSFDYPLVGIKSGSGWIVTLGIDAITAMFRFALEPLKHPREDLGQELYLTYYRTYVVGESDKVLLHGGSPHIIAIREDCFFKMMDLIAEHHGHLFTHRVRPPENTMPMDQIDWNVSILP
jgi:hypothetical protein